MNDLTYRREQAFIGAALMGIDAHGAVDLDPADFATEAYRNIWAYIRDQHSIDFTELEHRFPDGVLADAISAVPSMTNLQKCARHVRELAYRRRLELSLRLAADKVASGESSSAISKYVVAALDGAPTTGEAKHIREYALEAYSDLRAAHEEGKQINFVPTGMAEFDRKIGGLQHDGLIIVAGRPSMGKTSLACRIARNVGESSPVLVISMEMSGKQLAMRFLAAEEGVDLQAMMQGRLMVDDWRKLAGASERMANGNVWVNPRTSRTVADVAAEARRFKRANGSMGLLVVDYLTLLKIPAGETRALAVGEVSRAMKVLAGELGCPVVLLSQLNRDIEKRSDKRPTMADLRDSGAIEQDADQILFPYRPGVYDQSIGEDQAEIIVDKNRNGRTGIIRMAWHGASASYRDVE